MDLITPSGTHSTYVRPSHGFNSLHGRPNALLFVCLGGQASSFTDYALADPFDRPGQPDPTANVNFAYFAEAPAGTGTSLSHREHTTPHLREPPTLQ